MSTLLLSFALFLPQQTAQPQQIEQQTAIELIDGLYTDGEIDEEMRHFYRVALVKAPHKLPQTIKPSQNAFMHASRTQILVQAAQWIAKNRAYNGPTHNLLRPPTDLPEVIDSQILPIRVSYENSSQAQMAEAVLRASEESWNIETQQYGFHTPIMESDTDRYSVRIESTGMGGGAYTAPYEFDTSGQGLRCFTYIVFDKDNWEESINSTMAHELNHAMQASMDCLETTAFWENTATYIMGKVYPEDWMQTVMTFSFFQEQPWRSLSYMNRNGSDGYEYGGAIVLFYLEDTYASTDGPVLARQIWEASMQNSQEENEPDYLDAIDQVVQQRGGPGLEDLFVDFSESRFFVGQYDDNAHMTNSGSFYEGEVAFAERHIAADLPIVNKRVPSSARPEPLGSNQILVSVPHIPLQVSFSGEQDTRWHVRVLLSGNRPTASFDMDLDADGQGSLSVDNEGHEFLLLSISNLGAANFDPDNQDFSVSGYTYSVVAAPPVVTSLDPDTVAQGKTVEMELVGQGFRAGRDFDLSFDGDGLKVSGIEVEPERVLFTLTVAEGATPGERGLTVANSAGSLTVEPNMLNVVASKKKKEEPVGFSCAAAAGDHLQWAAGLTVIAALLLRRRS